MSTLEALAQGVDGVPFNGVICAAMDARCRQVYTANFVCRDGAVTRVTPDEAMSLDACLDRLQATEQRVLFVGDGAKLCCEAACERGMDATAAPNPLRYVRARGIALAAKLLSDQNAWITASQLQPMYLRLPQAERELKAKQALKG